jgi:hypothetical protein
MFKAVRFLALLFAVSLTSASLAADADEIPRAWLKERTTIAKAEAANPGITDDRVARFPDAAKAFGFQNREWEELKALVLPGDEIWIFSSQTESWKHLAGRAGVALVRDGVPIRAIVTMMN